MQGGHALGCADAVVEAGMDVPCGRRWVGGGGGGLSERMSINVGTMGGSAYGHKKCTCH